MPEHTPPRHLAHWPPGVPVHLETPAHHLFRNVELAAERYPDKPLFIFGDTPLSHAQFRADCEHLAGHLQQVCGVQRGDRVLLCMQNSPQFAIAYHAILRADAVVVPVNPMNLTGELRHLVDDAGAQVICLAQELMPQVRPLLDEGHATGTGLRHAVVAAYSDHLGSSDDGTLPEFVTAAAMPVTAPGAIAWREALAARRRPAPMQAGPDDLAVLPYTSGTTSQPKGCRHSHRSVMVNTVTRGVWMGSGADSVQLAVLPFFHVTGMQNAMNGTIHLGATAVILPRWDREAALRAIERHRVTAAQLISTMVVDLLTHPRIESADLSSLASIGGGGAAMPEAVAAKLKALTGLDYIEGYGMSETMAATHINPLHRPKRQCLGIPIFDVDARVVDPVTFAELPCDEVGEIIVHGPQVMQGYWRNPQADAESFVHLDGKRFLRTGDLARVDADGYFHMVDRLKRMINASGFKVWPAEVEALMYAHPAIQEVCVIAAHDARRGETVQAVVVLRPEHRGRVSEAELVDWAHTQMAAYKSPRIVTFTERLPKSGAGKILWRELQQIEQQKQQQEQQHRAAPPTSPPPA